MRDESPAQISLFPDKWDLRLPEVKAYLHERVIDFLRVHQFKYIKIDYNETLGIGPDDAGNFGLKWPESKIPRTKWYVSRCRNGDIVR